MLSPNKPSFLPAVGWVLGAFGVNVAFDFLGSNKLNPPVTPIAFKKLFLFINYKTSNLIRKAYCIACPVLA